MIFAIVWSVIFVAWAVMTILSIRARRQYHKNVMDLLNLMVDDLKLHKEALTWAVGTGKLPATCPGHFMHLLIEVKTKADNLEDRGISR